MKSNGKIIVSTLLCMAMAAALCFGMAACGKTTEYTLTFVTNGAGEIAPITAVAGADITPPADPQKADCVFGGWYETEDCSGSPVTIPNKMPSRNITYYASFTEQQKATLTVDFGGVKEQAEYKLTAGTNVSEFLSGIDTTSDKATFVGWYVGNVALKDTYTLPAGGATVRAEWEVPYTLNVYREYDDGYIPVETNQLTGKLGRAPTTAENHGGKAYTLFETYQLTGKLGQAPTVLENYGGKGYILSSDTEIPVLGLDANTVNLYYDLETFTFIYILDSTDSVNGYVQKDFKYNRTVTIDECELERDDYRFIGWATTEGQMPDSRYQPGQKVIVTASVNLYACWLRAYRDRDGSDIVWLNPYFPESGTATLERGDRTYEGEANGRDLVFSVGGESVHARVVDEDNYLFAYRDENYGFYAYYDYIDGGLYGSEILYMDGYGLATYNTVDLQGGLTAEYFGKYSPTEYNDFEFAILDVASGEVLTDGDGNPLSFYFMLGEYDREDGNFDGTFTLQGEESGTFIEYANGEFVYTVLLLGGYGEAVIYEYDGIEDDYVLLAEGKYYGTENYENAFGEWAFESYDQSVSFEFIITYVSSATEVYDVFIVYDEGMYGLYASSQNSSELYLDGYGSALYTSADEMTLSGTVVMDDNLVKFYAYDDSWNFVGVIYFNLDKQNKTYTQNDEGFVINGTVLTKYVGSSAIIEIPDGITEIGDSAFHYIDLDCTVISVTIPASVTSIGSRAFENNSTLRRVYVKSATPCTLGEKAFDWTGGDFLIIVPDESVELYRSADGWSKYKNYIFGEKEVLDRPEFEVVDGVLVRYNRKDMTGSVSLVLPDEVTEIADGVFRGVNYLVSVDLNNVTKIGADAFALCTGLETVVCPKLEEIGESAFLECCSLTEISLPAVRTIGVTAFSACYGLTHVTVGGNIESIGDMAFRECALSYSVGEDGNAMYVPYLLFVELTGDTLPDMGGTVFYGTQGRMQVKDISVALTCTANATWKKYVGTLYIPSGSEKGVYYDAENLQTLVLDGRAIVYAMEVWLYHIEDTTITFYVFDDDTCSVIEGTIIDGKITLQSSALRMYFIKEGGKPTYTDNNENELTVTLGGGDENSVSYMTTATYNGTDVELHVLGNGIYFDLGGYKYTLTLYSDMTFSAKVTVIPYTVHVTAADGSALDITFGSSLGVVGTFKNINGEERTAQTIGTWYITQQAKDVYTVTVIWRSDRYLVTVTVSGDSFEYEWKLGVSVTSYPDASTGNGVIVYTNAQGEIVDIHLMIAGEDGIKHDVSKDYVLQDDGTYVFVVNDTVESFDEETQEVIVSPSPYNGTYIVTLDTENRTCEIIYRA